MNFDNKHNYKQQIYNYCDNQNRDTISEKIAHYVEGYVPLSGVVWCDFNIKEQSINQLSVFSYDTKHTYKNATQLSEKIIIKLSDFFDRNKYKKSTVYILKGEENCVYKEIFKLIYENIASIICMPFEMNDTLAYVFLFSREYSYSESEITLCEQLRVPFSSCLKKWYASSAHAAEVPSAAEGKPASPSGDTYCFISGTSQKMRDVVDLVNRVADSGSTVLLLGETGSGKELMANRMHALSSRRNEPLVKINCAGISESLVDTELFGHEKGAFAGATHIRKGLLEQADGGTLFLDEIGDMSHRMQARLLRFLQFREIRRVGGIANIALNLRIIATSRQDLRAMIKKGTFREDLWFRLAVCPITIPPLRERREDILPLAEGLLKKKCREMRLPTVPTLSAKMRASLLAHDWPGNVRELENCIERSLLFCCGSRLALIQDGDMGGLSFPDGVSGAPAEEDAHSASFIRLDELISAHIRRVLEHTGWRVSGPRGAARILGLNPNTLHSKMRKLNITLPKSSSRKPARP